MLDAPALAASMATYSISPQVQLRQTAFRMQLVDQWSIPVGAKVLEIGCGQGDMTAALANHVGDRGSVVAVDIADESYGSPVNLGDSARHLMHAELCGSLEFRFGFDATEQSFEADAFDYVVLANCTWYAASLDTIKATLSAVRPWAKRLCLSEWDMEPCSLESFGHLLAVIVQGQVEAYKRESTANVRTPYSREMAHQILAETGWKVLTETVFEVPDLDDGRWEMDACVADSLREASELNLSPKHQAFLASQIDIVRRLRERGATKSLPCYAISAERSP